ncbi:MAG: ACT domain-containing protein [Eubacteriales bacterium]
MPFKPKCISDIFCAIAAEEIFVDIITQSPPKNDIVDIAFTLKKSDLNKAVEIIKKQINKSQIFTINNVSKITVEGEGMAKQSGVAAKVLGAFTQNKISALLIATSETKISICVNSDDTALAINTISQMLDL